MAPLATGAAAHHGVITKVTSELPTIDVENKDDLEIGDTADTEDIANLYSFCMEVSVCRGSNPWRVDTAHLVSRVHTSLWTIPVLRRSLAHNAVSSVLQSYLVTLD